MYSRLNGHPNLEKIPRGSHYGATAWPDTTGEGVIESMARSNGQASPPQVLHNSGVHQSHKEQSSSSWNAHYGVEKLERPSQAPAKGTKRCNSPAESSPRRTKISPSRAATCSCDDFDPTKSPPPINALLAGTSGQATEAESNHGKTRVLFSFAGSTPAASPGPSQPFERPPEAAVSQSVDDDPIYNIGEMKIYDQTQKNIPRLYEARWQVIRPDIFDRVHKRLGRGRFAVRLNKQKNPAIIELMSAGVTKACSIPAVLVVIPRHIKTMQGFLNTDSTVQNRCKPEDGTSVELLALACKGSSTLIGMPNDPLQNDLESQSDSNSEIMPVGDDSLTEGSVEDSDGSPGLHTLTTSSVLELDPQSVSVVHDPRYIASKVKHGMGISLITKDGSRCIHGTCGGLLQLTIPNEPPRQVGLMAGHLLEQLGQDSNQGSHKTTESPLIIGDIVYPQSSGRHPLYDWALFDATKLGFEHSVTNQISFNVAQEPDFPDTSTDVFVRTSRGEVNCTLSSSSSGIMLNPDQGFVHVRTIMTGKDSILTKGDSGAWVFQRGNGKVYGYIIATNGNDHAYMVPMHAAITEIKSMIGVASVSLAISSDPDPQCGSGTTHGHVEQADRSALFSDTDKSVQMSSIFSSPATSVRFESSSSHPDPRTDSTTVPCPAISVASIQEQLLQSDQSQLESQDRLAKAFLGEGRVIEAIKAPRNVVEPRENILGSNHTGSLASKHELAVAYIQNGQTAEAIRILKHVVETEAVAPGKSDIGRLASQHELARAFLAEGQVSEAIELLENVVAVKASILKQSDPRLLVSQHELSRAYLADGQVLEAIKLLEDVVAAKISILQRSDPHLLVSQHELARAYLADRRTSKAVQLLKDVVSVKNSVLQRLDPHLLISHHELARAYLADGRALEAIELLEDVAVKVQPLETSNPHVLALQIVLAEAYLRAGRASDAVNILEHVVTVATPASSKHEKIRAVSLQWLTSARKQRDGDRDKAEQPEVSDSLVAGTLECVYFYTPM